MDLNFTKVSYDGDLADFSEEELRELVGEFEDAQESNVAEFETAADRLEEVEGEIEEFEAARESLIGEITEAEQFEAVPVTEETLQGCDFGELREWREFVAEDDSDEDEDEDADEAGEFDDMGQEGPVNDDGEFDADPDVVEAVDGLSGVNVQ